MGALFLCILAATAVAAGWVVWSILAAIVAVRERHVSVLTGVCSAPNCTSKRGQSGMCNMHTEIEFQKLTERNERAERRRRLM